MKYRNWNVAPARAGAKDALVGSGLSPLLSAVLSARGVDSPEKARRLLCPREETLPDPLLMRDMARARDRIRQALERAEQLAVYGDYDVDGITSTCLLTEFLRGMGGRVIPYIPGRLEEGYGLNREAIRHLADRGVTLIITVDCGITAVDEVDYAAALGVDVVITDHHTCKDALPRAVAVVDPHREDCTYPFKGLAGVGVALKLAMAVAGPDGAGQVFEDYCDLAAVGTVADVMPMTEENRAIVSRGLRYLNPPRRPGLRKLAEHAGLGEKPINCVSVGYTLAPRINASGRMCQVQVALDLLLEREEQTVEQAAERLCELNRERQNVELEIFQESVRRLTLAPQNGAIVLSDSGWHQGVVGIVASRLAEKYGCPAFMICLDNGMGKGSCRSWGGVNLFRLLERCAPLLENFGGHALAAGFTVRQENIPALAQALRREAEACRAQEDTAGALDVDAAVMAEELTVEAVESLEQLEPCGTGNPRPVLALMGARVQNVSQVGRGRHLKLRLESRGKSLDAIFFSADAQEWELYPGDRVDAAFYPQINEFRGQRTVQMHLIDLRTAPSRAQMERDIYERFMAGEILAPAEAAVLEPARADFAELWRWLERHAAGGAVEDSLLHITRGASRRADRREIPMRTLLCLQVMQERGLLDLEQDGEHIRLTLHQPEHKVDLEASPMLKRLRAQAHPTQD